MTARAKSFVIDELDGPAAARAVPALAAVLQDCVEGGASVSFMAPLASEKATAFWATVAAAVARGERALLVARDDDGVAGTVQAVFALPENQPHRAEVAKLLVLRRARRQGVASALMAAIEDRARRAGKTLLTLDTMTGDDADRLYPRLGWQRCGVIPGFALYPDGRPGDTTVYWKRL